MKYNNYNSSKVVINSEGTFQGQGAHWNHVYLDSLIDFTVYQAVYSQG